jgi:putative hemolysin
MMSRTSIFVILGACIIAGLLVAGCTQQQAPAAAQTTVPTATAVATNAAVDAPANTGSAGIANPASVNCGKIGGTTEIKTAADGSQYGMCTFSNGTSCEEWALFRNEGCKTNVTIAATTAAPGALGMANPASVNCGKIGGTTEIKTAADGSQYGMCTFSNGTSCEEWALFRNEGCKTNVTIQATTPATAVSSVNATAVNASA